MRTLLLATAALVAVAPAARAQGEERQKIDTTFAFEKGGSIDLGHVSGDIVVTGWTKGDIKINAFIETGYLEATMSSSRVRITAHSRRGRMGNSRYELSVPIGTEVRASTVSGNVLVRGVSSEVTAKSVSGDVDVRDAGGRVELETVSGDIKAAAVNGRIRLHTVSGDVDVRDVNGEVSGKSVSGSLEAKGMLSNLEYESVSGDITFDGDLKAGGSFRANSHSGDLRFTVPANFSANVEVQTFSGDFRTSFPMTIQPGERAGRGRRMSGTIGGGGARLSLETFSGNVLIEKGTARQPKED